jgi:hypothetical protein
MMSRSPVSARVGTAGKRVPGGTGGWTSVRWGHGTHRSPAETKEFTQLATENGAKTLLGRAATAASYWARRFASDAAVTSHGNSPSVQFVA